MSMIPLLSVRGSRGLDTLNDTGASQASVPFDSSTGQRSANHTFTWSPDGKFFAFCNGESLVAYDVNNLSKAIFRTDRQRVSSIQFSPLSTYLITFEPFGMANQNKDNISVYLLHTQSVVAKFTQGSSDNWKLQFTPDEKVCCRLSNETALFFEDGQFEKCARTLKIPHLAVVALSPVAPHTVAICIGGTKKGTPTMVKILRYPDLDQYSALSSKSFFKADKVSLHWGGLGKGVVIKAMTEIDNTGQTYYGESMLFYISTSGDSSVVELSQKGPIYDMKWDPTREEFCVVFGHMPSRVTLYNATKCSSIFDFGTGLRTAVSYTPQGHLMALYGHGSVRSNVEIWHRESLRLVSRIEDFQDITFFDWCPTGERFVLATVSPTLKVDNKFSVFDYKGTKLFKRDPIKGDKPVEIWQIGWQQFPVTKYPARPLEFTPLSMQQVKVQQATEKKYVPPHLRKQQANQQPKNIVLDLGDLPENERASAVTSKPKSGKEPSGVVFKGSGGYNDLDESKRRQLRMKTLEKKLADISLLKEKQDAGQVIQKNAIDKINREGQIRDELAQLKANENMM